MSDDNVTKLGNRPRNTTSVVLGKLQEMEREKALHKLLAIAIIDIGEGKYAEIMIGSENIDRYDLLSASQQCRMSADALYRLLVEAGNAATSGKIN